MTPADTSHRVSIVWTALILATVLSWWSGTDHGIDDRELASVLVLIVAFIKIRLIGLHFMDLRDAPLGLRGIFEAWCLVVCSGVLTVYLVA